MWRQKGSLMTGTIEIHFALTEKQVRAITSEISAALKCWRNLGMSSRNIAVYTAAIQTGLVNTS